MFLDKFTAEPTTVFRLSTTTLSGVELEPGGSFANEKSARKFLDHKIEEYKKVLSLVDPEDLEDFDESIEFVENPTDDTVLKATISYWNQLQLLGDDEQTIEHIVLEIKKEPLVDYPPTLMEYFESMKQTMTEMNATESHVVIPTKSNEGVVTSRVVSTYIDQIPSHDVLDELTDWAEKNDEELHKKILSLCEVKQDMNDVQ